MKLAKYVLNFNGNKLYDINFQPYANQDEFCIPYSYRNMKVILYCSRAIIIDKLDNTI